MASRAARLEVVAGNAAGASIFVEDELVIGRYAEGPGRLAGDDEISRTHARITLDGSGFCAIEDLGSTNGTYVNGLRISGPQTLSRGDGIEVGGTTLVVRDLPQPVEMEAPTSAHGAPKHALASPEGASLREHDAAPPALAFRVEVDIASGEARILLEHSADPIRLIHVDGAWRVAPSGD